MSFGAWKDDVANKYLALLSERFIIRDDQLTDIKDVLLQALTDLPPPMKKENSYTNFFKWRNSNRKEDEKGISQQMFVKKIAQEWGSMKADEKDKWKGE